jgi:asparagine synthase (glutamine-hydrolysing)
MLSPATLRRRGIFDAAGVNELHAADQQGRIDASYTLLSIMCIEIWCRRFVDASPASA